jgi:hypothetical protein
MAALTRDHHVFAARITTGFSAVFFSIRYLAQAWHVGTLPHHLIRHFGSFCSGSVLRSLPHRNLDVALLAVRILELEGNNSLQAVSSQRLRHFD